MFVEPKGKLIGVDYGSVRIGIAMSDELGMMAFGKMVIKNDATLFNSFLKIIQSENISSIILGYPMNLKNEKTAQTLEVEKFEEKLKQFLSANNLNIDVIRWDERFTSKMAQESMIASGMKKKKRQEKSNLDIISATLMLQSYIDSQKK